MRSSANYLRLILLVLTPFWLIPLLLAVDVETGSHFEQLIYFLQTQILPIAIIGHLLQILLLVFIFYGSMITPSAIFVTLYLLACKPFPKAQGRITNAVGSFVVASLGSIATLLLQHRLAGVSMNRSYWRNEFPDILLSSTGATILLLVLLIAILVYVFPPFCSRSNTSPQPTG
jgi:hypothetical protein